MADWFSSKAEQDNFAYCLEKVYQGKIDTWDYQWQFASRLNGRIAVMPNANLISNIGFGVEATHTTGPSEFSGLPVVQTDYPIKHPMGIFASVTLDNRFNQRNHQPRFSQRIKSAVRKILAK
jgi:hypothetical protein